MEFVSYFIIVCSVWNIQIIAGADDVELIDMTHPFNNNTIYFPGLKHFTITNFVKGQQQQGYWLEVNNFEASEHGGTHMDAPRHFNPAGWGMHEIPIERFIAPAVVVDVSRQVAGNPDYEMTVDDLKNWEEKHGPIEHGAVVFLYANWSRNRWPNTDDYFGTNLGLPVGLHFPGFSLAAVQWLTENRIIYGIGSDTASPDPGIASNFPVHVHILNLNLYIIENVNSLWMLPPVGATVYAFPMKITDGSGAPCRLIAQFRKDGRPLPQSGGTETINMNSFASLVLSLAVLLFVI